MDMINYLNEQERNLTEGIDKLLRFREDAPCDSIKLDFSRYIEGMVAIRLVLRKQSNELLHSFDENVKRLVMV